MVDVGERIVSAAPALAQALRGVEDRGDDVDERHLGERANQDSLGEPQVRQYQQTVNVKDECPERALPEHDEDALERPCQRPVAPQQHVHHRQGDRQVQQAADAKIAQGEVAIVKQDANNPAIRRANAASSGPSVHGLQNANTVKAAVAYSATRGVARGRRATNALTSLRW